MLDITKNKVLYGVSCKSEHVLILLYARLSNPIFLTTCSLPLRADEASIVYFRVEIKYDPPALVQLT
jgi:hypothetical protein